MGHQIVYCGQCGKGLRHDDFDRGKAVLVEMIAYCLECSPAEASANVPTATPRRAQAALRAASSTRLRVGSGEKPKIGTGAWFGAGAAAAVLLAIVVVLSTGKAPESPPPPAPAGRPPEALRAAPAPPNAALAELRALEMSGAEPEAILLRCERLRAELKGTPGEATLRQIEARAAEGKARRDRDRRFEAALRSVREIIDSPRAVQRKPDVLALLAAAAELAGLRQAEVDALEARYRAILARAEETPAPPPPVPPPALPAGVLAFQDGVHPTADYRGTQDATLSEAQPDRIDGKGGQLEADGDEPTKSGKDRLFLLRWDLSSVAPGTRIASAEIVLRVVNSTKQPYTFHPLLRPWKESESCWWRASADVPWETPGARGPGDRRAEPAGRVSKASGTVRIALDPAVVQEWIDRPSTNHGLVLDGPESSDGVVFRSRESDPPGERPKLELKPASF